MGRVLFDGAWRPIAEVVALLASPVSEAVAAPTVTDEDATEPPEEVEE